MYIGYTNYQVSKGTITTSSLLHFLTSTLNKTGPKSKKSRKYLQKLQTELFLDFVRETGLTDLPLGRKKYTWPNMRTEQGVAGLDRFLVTGRTYTLRSLNIQCQDTLLTIALLYWMTMKGLG